MLHLKLSVPGRRICVGRWKRRQGDDIFVVAKRLADKNVAVNCLSEFRGNKHKARQFTILACTKLNVASGMKLATTAPEFANGLVALAQSMAACGCVLEVRNEN